jgi:adenylyl cyclase-associated protein
VLLEYRNKDETHVNWCKALKALFVELKAYVKMHHPTGPAWDPKGVEVAALGSAAAGSAAAPPRPPASNAPAPPPPPPPGTLTAPRGGAGAAAKPAGPGMSAVLSALNKGEAVTSGLKKVTDDMKTKNR